MKSINLIRCLLLIAIFSAVLRPSPDSPLTLFRLLIPFYLWVISRINRKIFIALLSVCGLFALLSVIQSILTSYIIYPQIRNFSFVHLLEFYIHWVSIFIVVAIILCLKYKEKQNFVINTINFSSRIVKFSLLLYLLYIVIGGDPMTFSLYGNVNNFGCVLAGGLLALLCDTITKRPFKIVYSILILGALVFNDSKLALLGALLGGGLYVIHRFFSIISKTERALASLVLIIGIFFGVRFFVSSALSLNGYDLTQLILLPIEQVKSGQFFNDSAQSYTYRTNCIIGIGRILRDSWGLGVGTGNTAVILGNFLPNLNETYNENSLSSHIWWFEVMADIGWIIIIPMIKIFFAQIRSFVCFRIAERKLFSQIFVISFPLWSMSASGLYTEFFTIMLITVSVISYRQKKIVIENRQLPASNKRRIRIKRSALMSAKNLGVVKSS